MDAGPKPIPFNPLNHPIAFETPRYVDGIGWEEHIPFAMALVDIARPRKIVELGVHSGDSYLAFCQAVQHLGIEAACWGVDTWKGDAHAGYYGEQVLATLEAQHSPYAAFSRLMRMTFDEALNIAENGSVDLLHIDGFHSYEAVQHDLETWLPKVSSRGIVLMHDIREQGRGFEVWKYWAEVEAKYPSFAFDHGHGLGVLFVGSDIDGAVRAFRDAVLEQAGAAAIRGLFAALGDRVGTARRSQRLQQALTQRAVPVPVAADVSDQVRREVAALLARVSTLDALVRPRQ